MSHAKTLYNQALATNMIVELYNIVCRSIGQAVGWLDGRLVGWSVGRWVVWSGI